MAFEGCCSNQVCSSEDENQNNGTEIIESYEDEDINNGEDNNGEHSRGGAEGNLRDDKAVNHVDDLLKIRFEDMTAEEVVEYHFCDLNIAFMFYNWYASSHGFAGRRCRTSKCSNGEVVQQEFVCHREGSKVVRRVSTPAKKRAARPNLRCGCQAKITVHVDSSRFRWYIKKFNDVHNHSLLEDNFKGMLPAHRKMTEYDKYTMTLMRDAGMSTANIYGYVAQQSGGFEKLGYSRRNMYNEQVKQRKSKFSDAKEAMDYLASMYPNDSGMFFRHRVDEDGHLQDLFWCDGISRLDYSVFGDVVAFDATYKKLKYLSPFVVFSGVNHHNQSIVFASGIVRHETDSSYVWMLQQFLEAMGGKSPVSVITDGCKKMKKAIAKVFPTAHHRLCAWHLLRNATKNVQQPKFVAKLKHLMFSDMDVAEFNQKWGDMVKEFKLEEDSWVLELYERRNTWATACIRGRFFAGFRTTSRCEGLNSEIARYVSVLSNLKDFVKHLSRWVELMRYREFEADYASASYVEPEVVTQYRSLEKSAASVYTKEMFEIFREVLKRASNCFVRASSNVESDFFHTIFRYDKPGMQWEVTYNEVTLKFKCCCLRFESLGIPCEHIVCVLLYFGVKEIPQSLVLKRWTRFAKDGLTYPSGNRGVCRDDEFISTYVGIVERCKRMGLAACEAGKPELVRKLLEFISLYTGFFEAICRGEDVGMPEVDPYRDGTIKNPLKPRAKAPSDIPSSSQKSKTPKKRGTCTSCGKKGHNRRSCHLVSPVACTQVSEVGSSGCNEDDVDSDDGYDFEDGNIYMAYE